MIKLIFCVHKADNISLDEFRRIWIEKYKQKFIAFATSAKVKKLEFNLTLLIEANTNFMIERGTAYPYDAAIELYWDNANNLTKIIEEKEVQTKLAELRAVSDSFLDITKSRLFFVECEEAIDF